MQGGPKSELTRLALSHGAALFGVCRVGELRQSFHPEIKNISEQLDTAISIGVPVANTVLATLIDRPNMIYKAHYRQINTTLDNIAFLLTREIQNQDHRALPIPASLVLKRYPMIAHLSHREIAFKAGLGWWGRNNLLVTPRFGSQIRLVTVLTDLAMEPDRPLERDCGKCRACVAPCPAGAIAEHREDFNLAACSAMLKEFSGTNNYGAYICGLCLKPCGGKK